MALTQNEIARMLMHDDATAERVKMVAKVTRKRTERARTLERRGARYAKFYAQGRV